MYIIYRFPPFLITKLVGGEWQSKNNESNFCIIFFTRQVLVEDQDGWKLVTVDENKQSGAAPVICHKILFSKWFRYLMMVVIVANGISTARMNFKHDGRPRGENHYIFEVSL